MELDKIIEYTLIIDDDNDFSSPVLKKSEIRTSSYLLNSHVAFPPNTVLYWKVETMDASGKIVTCRQTDMSFRIKIKKSGVAK